MRETPRARSAFTDYVALGDGRSLERLVERYQSEPEASPTNRLATLKRWSAAFRWQERIAALVAQQEEEAAEHWARFRAEHREHMRMTGEQLLARASEMLKWPIATRTVAQGENGEQIVTLTPARWTFADAARMVEIADRLVRLSLGMDTDRRLVTVADVRKTAKQLGISAEDLTCLVDAMDKGEDVLRLAEAVAARAWPRRDGRLTDDLTDDLSLE